MTDYPPAICGAHYDAHPTNPDLVAVCAKPSGHDDAHDNVLPKPSTFPPAICGERETRPDGRYECVRPPVHPNEGHYMVRLVCREREAS